MLHNIILVLQYYREIFWSTYLHGLTYGFSQAIIFVIYGIVFRFGAFQIVLAESNVVSTNFDQILVVFVALVFGAAGSGQASSYVPNYAKAKLAAARIFHLLDRKPTIDSYSEDGLKLVCYGLYIIMFIFEIIIFYRRVQVVILTFKTYILITLHVLMYVFSKD